MVSSVLILGAIALMKRNNFISTPMWIHSLKLKDEVFELVLEIMNAKMVWIVFYLIFVVFLHYQILRPENSTLKNAYIRDKNCLATKQRK